MTQCTTNMLRNVALLLMSMHATGQMCVWAHLVTLAKSASGLAVQSF